MSYRRYQTALRTMLMNKVYTGYIVGFGLTVRGDFDPIVSEIVFYRVQPKLHRKPKATQVRYLRDNPEFPLRGVVRCPTCGHMMTASQSKGNGGKCGYYSCSNCGKSRFPKEALGSWFVQELRGLSLDKECIDALSLAVDGNLEANRKWVRNETNRLSARVASLKEEKDAIIEKCLKGVIPDEMVKEWLGKTSMEEEALKCRLALVAESALDTPEVLKYGLGILGDLASVWEKSNLSTRQQLQGFVFPQGVTARKSGFGTDPIALCSRSEELPASVITSVVDPGDSSWNLLLTELSQLSRIVEQSANDRGDESSSTAAPELGDRWLHPRPGGYPPDVYYPSL